jgi:ornithine cyclodeaminase/alanine dehydrogenase-like protein (mu-crystallin family)
MTLVLSNEDVEAVLDIDACLEAMETAYRDLDEARGVNGVRSEILTPTARDDALYSLLTMQAVIPKFGVGAVRINSDILTWPNGPGGLRRVKVPAAPHERYVGLVLLFSTETGEPLAIYPDGVVQKMRVAATCGLGAKYMAREDARDAAILGSGWQADGQAMAIAAVRPIERLRGFSPSRERREAFARETAQKLGIEVVAAESAREAVKGSHVVMCATNSMQPVFPPEWLEPGMHVSSLKTLELPPETIAKADIVATHVRTFPTRTERAKGADLARDTERQKATLSSTVKQDAMPDLVDLICGRAPKRKSPRDITVFINYAGLGYQFAATGHVIHREATARGLGRNLDTDWFTSAVPS